MEAWLSWLEHTVHIREVVGSSPTVSTKSCASLVERVMFFCLTQFLLAKQLIANKKIRAFMRSAGFGERASAAAAGRRLPLANTNPTVRRASWTLCNKLQHAMRVNQRQVVANAPF